MKSGIEREKYLERIKEIIVFRSFHEKELEAILEFCEIISFQEEEMIVAEGDLSPSFFAVIEGTVRVSVKQEEKDVYICSLVGIHRCNPRC